MIPVDGKTEKRVALHALYDIIMALYLKEGLFKLLHIQKRPFDPAERLYILIGKRLLSQQVESIPPRLCTCLQGSSSVRYLHACPPYPT